MTPFEKQARLAYLRQELTAPAAALADHARRLANAPLPDPAVGPPLLDAATKLLATVTAITAGESQPHDDTYWRQVRHDLRGAAGFVVSACEDIAEGVTLAQAAAITPHLQNTLFAARRVLDLIEAVVRFGRAPDATTAAPVVPKLPATDRGAPGRILVVDDTAYHRDQFARRLTADGHQVETAPTAAAALARLAQPPPVDLILLDVLMPEMTGPELLARLKADARFRDIPVVMMSALDAEDAVLACIAAGAEDYLVRPVNAGLLRARIAGGLEKKRLRDREAAYQSRIAGLVRAIFPPAVVAEWETTGTIRPRRHDRAGVLFLDIVGFSTISETYRDDPGPLVARLQAQVERFEATVARHGVQKIKTIGDAFMAVAGLPDPDPTPGLTLLKCGLDLIADTAFDAGGWQVRVGVHVGPVVAGVLGTTQFGFDLWGATVNAAARVEAHGRPGTVTLSAEAWRDVADVADGDARDIAARNIGVMRVHDFIGWRAA